MPPFARTLVIGLVLALIVGLASYKWFEYRERKAELEHEKRMDELQHEQKQEERLWDEPDDIDRELERQRGRR